VRWNSFPRRVGVVLLHHLPVWHGQRCTDKILPRVPFTRPSLLLRLLRAPPEHAKLCRARAIPSLLYALGYKRGAYHLNFVCIPLPHPPVSHRAKRPPCFSATHRGAPLLTVSPSLLTGPGASSSPIAASRPTEPPPLTSESRRAITMSVSYHPAIATLPRHELGLETLPCRCTVVQGLSL
jgi:hypothetical protein